MSSSRSPTIYLQHTLLLLHCIFASARKNIQTQNTSFGRVSLRNVGMATSSQIEFGSFEDTLIDALCGNVSRSNGRVSKWTVAPEPLICDMPQSETNLPGVYVLNNDQTEAWGVSSEDGSRVVALLGRKSMIAQTVSGLEPGVMYQINFKRQSHPVQEMAGIRVGLWHFGQPILENGDFETDAPQVNSQVDQAIPGWSSGSNGATFLVSNENGPFGGLSSQDGHMHVALRQQGALVRQEIQVIPSVKYVCSFRAATRQGDMAVLRVQVTLAEDNVTVHKMLSAGNDAGPGEARLTSSLEEYELSFTALSSKASIEFENLSPTTANLTVFIDAIKVSIDPWVLNEERMADFGPLNLVGNGDFEAKAVSGGELSDSTISVWESTGRTALFSSMLGKSGEVFPPEGIVFVGLETVESDSESESGDSDLKVGAIFQQIQGLVPEMAYTLKFYAAIRTPAADPTHDEVCNLNPSCKGNGASYRGCRKTTISGLECQRWDTQSPHLHTNTPESRPTAGLDSNFCRNPNGEPAPWCYTTEPAVRWTFCFDSADWTGPCESDAATHRDHVAAAAAPPQEPSLRVQVTEVGDTAPVVIVERVLGVSDLGDSFSEFELRFTAPGTSAIVKFENLAPGVYATALIDGIQLTSDTSAQDMSRERLVSVARSATNRLQNGDFEATARTVRNLGFVYRPLPGWVSAGRTALVYNGNAAWGSVSSHDGAVYAVLEGRAHGSAAASLSQRISGLVPGFPYALRFQAASHPQNAAAGGLVVCVTEHHLDGSSSVLAEMTQQNVAAAVETEAFAEFEVTFTTSTGSVSVHFEHVAPAGAVDNSIFIDAISLMLDPRFVYRITPPPVAVANGDFEAAALLNWTPTGSTPDLVTNGDVLWGGLDSGDGLAFIALNGYGIDTRSAVSQTISDLLPGGRYTVVFLAASRPEGPLGSLRVCASTPRAVLTSATFEDMDPWFKQYAFSFTTPAAQVDIKFEIMDISPLYSVFVDAISVSRGECDWESDDLSSSAFEDSVQRVGFVAPPSGQVTLVFRPSYGEDGVKADMCAGPEGPQSEKIDTRDAIVIDSVRVVESNTVRGCPAGWLQHGQWCKNSDECQLGLHNCHERAACSDTEGSFTCACEEGWVGDGLWCSWDDGIATEAEEDGWIKILEDATITGYPEFPEQGIAGFSQPVSPQKSPMGKRGKVFKPLAHGKFRKIKAVYKAGFIGCFGTCTTWDQCVDQIDLLATPWNACQRIPLEDRRDMPVFGLVLCPDDKCHAESPQTPIVSSQNLYQCKVTGATDLICEVDLTIQPDSEETLITVVPYLQGRYRRGFMQSDGTGKLLFDLWALPRYCDGDGQDNADSDSQTSGSESQEPSFINLINSDFEAPCPLVSGSSKCASIPGWTTSGGNVKRETNAVQGLDSGDGSRVISLFSEYRGDIASISQTVDGLIPETEYSLNFLIASAPWYEPYQTAVTVTDPESGRLLLVKHLQNLDNTRFSEAQLSFTAVGSAAEITFAVDGAQRHFGYAGYREGSMCFLDRILLSVRIPDVRASSECQEAPVTPPTITAASIEQSSSVPDAPNTLVVTIQLNSAVSSQTVGSFAISGLMGARMPSGSIPLRPITPGPIFCVDGAPDLGIWTTETETLTMTLCSGTSVSRVAFSFEVTNPGTPQGPPAIQITALHPSTGAEVIPPLFFSTSSTQTTAAEAHTSEVAALFVKQPELKASAMWVGLHPLTQLATFSAVLQVNMALLHPDVITIALHGLNLGPADVDVPLDGWGNALPFCTAAGSQSSGWWDSTNARLVLSLCADTTLPSNTPITFSAVVSTANVAAAVPGGRVFDVTAGSDSHFFATAQVPASRFPVLGVSSQDSDALRALMPALPPGSSLWFGPGLHTACDLTLASHGVALRGLAATWDCMHAARHLTITANEVFVQGLRFVRGASASHGGSLRLEGNRTWVADCEFEYNSAENGGAISSAGILVMSGQNLLSSNVAEASGGAVFLGSGGSLQIESGSSTFQLNRALMGGAVYGSEFSVICLSGTETTAPVLKNNLADSHGGGVFLSAYSQLCLAQGVVFEGNSASRGGAVYCSSFVQVTLLSQSTLSKNSAWIAGGGIAAPEGNVAVVLHEAVLRENEATQQGGAIFAAAGSMVTVQGETRLEGNRATYGEGGGVHVRTGCQLRVGDSVSFAENKAADVGGGIYGLASAVEIDGEPRFEGNIALSGGAVAVQQGQVTVGGSSHFLYNVAMDAGGAVAVSDSAVVVSGDARFSGNHAYEVGGAIVTSFSSLLISDRVLFEGNQAMMDVESWGGAILVIATQAQIEGQVVFKSNRASGGGAIAVYTAWLVMTGASLEGNWARERGGAIVASQGASAVVRDCRFEGNIAWSMRGPFSGGAIMVDHSTTLEVWHTTFHDHACEQGGTIYARLAERVALHHVTITKSYAVEAGGCIYADASDLEISDSTLSGCNGWWSDFVWNENRRYSGTLKGGGGILVFASQLSIHRSNILDCNGRIGGAICSSQGADVFIVDTTIANNSADSGGAVAHLEGSILLRDVRIIGNVAREGNGGGLLLSGSDARLENHNVIESNSAAAEGGGIFSLVALEMPDLEGGSLADGRYAKTVVASNRAGTSGGGISTHGAMQMGLEHTMEYRNNSAQLDGGALLLQSGARVEREDSCGCPQEWNTDVFCTPGCQNFRCNWDDGFCHSAITGSLGELVTRSCTSTRDECHFTNMRPDCDFNRGQCRAHYDVCPMGDATLLSIYLGTAGEIERPSWDPNPYFPVNEYRLTWARGGEVGFGRCMHVMAECTEATLASPAIFSGISGRVGATAVSLLRGSEWLHVSSTSTLQTLHRNLTVEAWVNVPSTAPEVLTVIASETMSLQLRLNMPTRANAAVMLTVGAFVAEGCCFELDQWQQVAVVMSSGSPVQVYIDGHRAQMTSAAELDVAPAPVGPVWGMALGRIAPGTPDPGLYFHGHIDEVRLWASAREQAQVTRDMDRPCRDLALADPSLLACYGFEGNLEPDDIADEAFSHLQADGSPARAIDGQQHASWCNTNFQNQWGFCTDHPWLPGAGFDYDKDYLLNLTTLTTVDLFTAHPECGLVLNSFTGNTAKRNGGAIAKTWCAAEQDLCFIDGINALHPDHSMSYFAENIAGRAGGAVWDQCTSFAEHCSKRRLLAIPWFRNGVADVAKIQYVRNVAHGYGNDIATMPREVKIFGVDNEEVVKDMFNSQSYQCVRDDKPGGGGGYALLDSCHSDELVVRDSWTGVLRHAGRSNFGQVVQTMEMMAKAIIAPYEADQVTITFERIDVGACARQRIVVYECSTPRCGDKDQSELARICQGQVHWPDGSTTDGMNQPELTSRTGIMMVMIQIGYAAQDHTFHARWRTHIKPEKLHLLPETSYIPGEQPLNFGLMVTDGRGQRVQEGNELVQPALIAASVCATADGCNLFSPIAVDSFLHSTSAAVDGYISTLPQDNQIICTPRKQTVPQPASNESAVDTSVVRFQLGTEISSGSKFPTARIACAPCPVGSTRVDEEAGWRCVKCDGLAGNDYYSATPNKLGSVGPSYNCLRCPDGALCSEGQFRGGKIQGSVWELDSERGAYVLESCPFGHQMVRSLDRTATAPDALDFVAELQTCVPCLQELEYMVNESTAPCQPCPLGARCFDATFSPLVPGSVWERVNNSLRLSQCPAGFIGLRNPLIPELDQCIACPRGTYSLVPAIVGGPLFVSAAEQAEGKCFVCPDMADCAGTMVSPRRNYWATTNVPTTPSSQSPAPRRHNHTLHDSAAPVEVNLYRCLPGACLGDGQCAAGREPDGVLCALCKPDHVLAGQSCKHCTVAPIRRWPLVGIVCALAFVLCLMILEWPAISSALTRPKTDRREQKSESKVQAVVSAFEAIKLALGFFQVLSTFLENLAVEWPQRLATGMAITSISNGVSWSQVPGLDCVSGFGHDDDLRARTLSPLVPIVMLPCMASLLPRWRTRPLWTPILGVLFVTFPSATVVSLQTFICETIMGKAYLKKDFNFGCPRTEGTWLYSWAIVSSLGFTLGVPLLAFCTLWWFKVPTLAARKRRIANLDAFIDAYERNWMAVNASNRDSQAQRESSESAGSNSGGNRLSVTLGFSGAASGPSATMEKRSPDASMEDVLASLDTESEHKNGKSTCLADMLMWEVDGDAPPETETRVRDEHGVVLVSQPEMQEMVSKKADRLALYGLIRVQRPVWDGSSGFEEQRAIESVGIAFASYYCDSWFFEIWEFFRKFAMTALISVIYPGTIGQTEVALAITAIALGINVLFKPRVSPILQGMQTHALSNLFCILFFGLIIHIDQIAESPSPYLTTVLRRVIETIAIMLCFTVILYPFIMKFVVLRFWSKWRGNKKTGAQANLLIWQAHDEMLDKVVSRRNLILSRAKSDTPWAHTDSGNQGVGPGMGVEHVMSESDSRVLPEAAGVGSLRTLTPPPMAPAELQEDGCWTPDPMFATLPQDAEDGEEGGSSDGLAVHLRTQPPVAQYHEPPAGML